MNDTRRAIKGVQWNYAATAVQMAAQLLFAAVVSRLLEPADFGLMAIATVIVRFGQYLAGAGIRSYLIQKKDLEDADVRAALAAASGMGVMLCGTVLVIAPWAADMFRTPGAEPVMRALALSFLLQALTIPAFSLLHRALRFRAIAVIETLGYLVGYMAFGIVLAMNGFGVWSLVAAALLQQLLVLGLSLRAVRVPFGFAFERSAVKEIASKGGHFAMNSILDYCVLAAPTVFVGHRFGAADLGIFNRASTLINLPTYAVSAAISRVVLPYIAPMQSERTRLARASRRCAMLSAWIFLPLCIGMIPAAPEIVLFVLGDRWVDAVPVFQVLTAAMAMHLVAVQLGSCADAIRKLGSRTALSVAALSSMILAMYLLRGYGLVGAAAGMAAGQAVRLALYGILVSRWLGYSPSDWLSTYAPGVIVGLGVAAATAAARELLAGHSTAALLAAEITAGGTAFVIVTFLYPQRGFKDTLGALLDYAGVRRMPLLGSVLRYTGLRATGVR